MPRGGPQLPTVAHDANSITDIGTGALARSKRQHFDKSIKSNSLPHFPAYTAHVPVLVTPPPLTQSAKNPLMDLLVHLGRGAAAYSSFRRLLYTAGHVGAGPDPRDLSAAVRAK